MRNIKEARKRIRRILKSHNKHNYKINKINIQNNSINGFLMIRNKKYFYKLIKKSEGNKEFQGYLKMIAKYPIPGLYKSYNDYDDHLLIYEYESSISKNKGLLVDLINQNLDSKLKISIKDIFSVWKENYSKSIKWSKKPTLNENFFKDRIKSKSRFDKWYKHKHIQINKKKYSFINLLKRAHIINGKLIKETPYNLYLSTKKELTKSQKKIVVLSTGDPIEMNIGTKPVFFDFENSGTEDFIGEAAIFIFSTLIDGGYFSPKYHKNAFWLHPKTIKNIKKHKYKFLNYHLNKNSIIIDYDLEIQTSRRKILEKYFKTILYPLSKKAKLKKDILFDKLNKYLFARFLLVHNISNMTTKDMLLNISMISEINDIGLKKYLKLHKINI
jgi:hypothetical protein